MKMNHKNNSIANELKTISRELEKLNKKMFFVFKKGGKKWKITKGF